MALNAMTMLPASGVVCASPRAAADLFARAAALLPALPRGELGPGYRVFWLDRGAIAWRDVVGDGADHLVVGRHSCTDVELRGDDAIALRHLCVRARRSPAGLPELEVLDLRANQPVFVDGSDEPQRSFVAEGSVAARLGSHVLCALPVDACVRARAEALAPESVPSLVITGSSVEALPRKKAAPRLEGAREPVPRSHTTTLRPAPHTTDLDALRPSAEPPWVRLVIRSPEGCVEHRLARADLRGLVLVGRYSRCQAAHGGLLEGDVSRVHAGVIARGDGVEVIDLASTNGISVDGQKVRRVLVERAATVRLGQKGCAIEIAYF